MYIIQDLRAYNSYIDHVGMIASLYSYIATFFHIPVKVVASNKYAYTYIGIPEHGMLKYLLVLRNLAAQHIFERTCCTIALV